ncbi:MAG: ABC transporter ATP-binding protein [Xenococcaceae cyanobacterium MO_188.B32]|nr:ABC transporter ATP-binding protein [Xenococcaceae cyanobacterium MO_188.B32]
MTDQPSSSKTEDSEVVLSVEGVSKKFCRDLKRSLFYGVQDIASDLLGIREKSDKIRKKEFWALDNVSFELRRGEALGLVGKNGSGKSTLLRIIAGLIKPDLGTVKVKGRVAPLIALGAGFNPILTGRENIYANMSILGLTKQEIDDRFDEVVEFAEIGDAIDSPVQTYSSGMAARLGFATAIHTEPDILLIDEVLSVGDIKFRGKCTRKLADLRTKGTSFLIVSHNSSTISYVCQNAVYLCQGELVTQGRVNDVLEKYEEDLFLNKHNIESSVLKIPKKSKSHSHGLDIKYVCFKDEQGIIIESPKVGEYAALCVGCSAWKNFSSIALFVNIRDLSREGESILKVSNYFDRNFISVTDEEIEIQFQMTPCHFRQGIYEATLVINTVPPPGRIDEVESFKFQVKDRNQISGIGVNTNMFYQPRQWQVLKSISFN